MAYQPSRQMLETYADVLVNFALNGGEGIKKGEVVRVILPDMARPLYEPLMKAILKAGGQPMMRYVATGFDKTFYELANKDQLTFFPKDYIRARIDLVDHTIGILADRDPHELQGVDPKKIFKAQEKNQQIRDWQNKKELAGEYTWTLALYGTEAMAEEANLSLEEYWGQIIRACYLDKKDPKAEWQRIFDSQEEIKTALNDLPIDKLHVEAEDINLWLTLGKKRQWLGGSGRNIPSFEIFTSPDWQGTEGHIAFNQPLYRYGNLIEGIELKFEEGKVVKATAEKNEEVLQQMVAQTNADKVGEFSLTDSRHTRIDTFMANTLYDENIGAKNGNTHIAVGMAYKEAYTGDANDLGDAEWEELGFNNSAVHTDMVSTTERKVTAILEDGSEQVIYDKGQFRV